MKIIKNDEHLKTIPVVILTTSSSEEDLRTAYQNNTNSYLVKLADLVKFGDMLKSAGEYWLGLNRR